jgi:hypothetical protein
MAIHSAAAMVNALKAFADVMLDLLVPTVVLLAAPWIALATGSATIRQAAVNVPNNGLALGVSLANVEVSTMYQLEQTPPQLSTQRL